MKIGFAGLGRMGSAIARNLIRAGHDVTVYNRTRSASEALAGEGARIADTPADAAAGAGAVLTMLADDHAVTGVVFGDNGIAGALPAGAVHVSHSTISVDLSKRLAGEHASRGQRYVAAPVFGRPEAAENAKLVIAAAGAPDAIDACRPLFEAVGQRTLVAGDQPAMATIVKLCGNFMIASMLETFSEAFATLRKSGVDPNLFLEIINGLFRSPVYENYGKAIAEQRFEPAGFALKLGLKDVRLVLAAAEDAASPMPIASLIHDRFVAAMALGQADLDWSSIAKIAELEAGLSPRS